MNENEQNIKKLIPMTVRFSEEAMSVFDDIASQQGISKAELLRLAIDNRLSDFLQKCIYIEHEDAEEIKKILFYIYTEMQSIRIELNRIGVNFNQELKQKNIQKKYQGKFDYDKMKQKINGNASDTNTLDYEKLDTLMTRFEKAVDDARLILCHIQE